MDTQTRTRKKTEKRTVETEKPLDRTEATWVATWLSKIGKEVDNGWMGVYKMLPSVVAEKFSVKLDDVQSALRGDKR